MSTRPWRRRPSPAPALEDAQVSAVRHRSNEATFRALVQHSSDLITVVDAELVIRYQSPSLERVLGYSAAELTGTSVVDLLHPDEAARAVAEWAETLSQA